MVRVWICLFVLAPGLLQAADPAAAYRSLLASIRTDHTAVSKHWYQMLDQSEPAPKPSIVRFSLPRILGNAAMSFEIVHVKGMSPDTRMWTTTGKPASYLVKWKSFKLTGTPALGMLTAEFQMDLPG